MAIRWPCKSPTTAARLLYSAWRPRRIPISRREIIWDEFAGIDDSSRFFTPSRVARVWTKIARVRRRLFKSAFLLSIFLCVGLSILCLRSFWIADAWGWSCGKRTIQCGLAAGRLRLDTTLFGEEGGEWPHPSLDHVQYRASVDPPTRRLPATFGNLGFSFERRSQPRNYTSSLVLIP